MTLNRRHQIHRRSPRKLALRLIRLRKLLARRNLQITKLAIDSVNTKTAIVSNPTTTYTYTSQTPMFTQYLKHCFTVVCTMPSTVILVFKWKHLKRSVTILTIIATRHLLSTFITLLDSYVSLPFFTRIVAIFTLCFFALIPLRKILGLEPEFDPCLPHPRHIEAVERHNKMMEES